MAREFKKIDDSEFIKLGKENDEGETIYTVEGTVQGKSTILIRGNQVGRYNIVRDDGSSFTILGAQRLDEKMGAVNIGTYVRITLEQETTATSGGNQMKNYTVEIAE